MKPTPRQAQQAVIRADACNPSKHNDNAKPLKKAKKKTARNTCTHWALLSVDMLPKIAHACSFMGLEKGLDLG